MTYYDNSNRADSQSDKLTSPIDDPLLQELDPERLADNVIPAQLERELETYDLADPDDYEVQQELASGLEVRPEDARRQRIRLIRED